MLINKSKCLSKYNKRPRGLYLGQTTQSSERKINFQWQKNTPKKSNKHVVKEDAAH